MNQPNHIIDADHLRRISGKKSVAAIRRWASRQGIRCGEGATGPWTTLQALNFALGVSMSPAGDDSYGGDILLPVATAMSSVPIATTVAPTMFSQTGMPL